VSTRARPGGQSWTLSVLLHLVIAAAIFGAWYRFAHRPQPVEDLGIQARVVSAAALAQTPPAPAPQPAPAPETLPQEPPAQASPEPQPAPTPPAPETDAAQAAQAQQQEDARVAEERRLAAEREDAERQAAQKAERDREEKERQAREKAAQDKAARDKAAREKAEKEKAAQAERERVAREQAAQQQAEKARQQREDELATQLAAEDRLAAVRASGLQNQWTAQIVARVEGAWKQPPSATAGLDCEVRVTQVPGGVVTGVSVGHCNGDEAVRQSIQNAVLAASPLPPPPDPSLFDRTLKFNFRPTKLR